MKLQIKRIGISFMLLLLFSISPIMAQLNISASNTEIKNVLRQIEEKSDYSDIFLYRIFLSKHPFGFRKGI
ncbi:MAG: hypothetical protein GXX03_04035 [Bacteroidales bacterium]|nr:hypothetical protein [Bacteroidales bacterium]